MTKVRVTRKTNESVLNALQTNEQETIAKRSNEQHLYAKQSNEQDLRISRKIPSNAVSGNHCFPLCFPICFQSHCGADLTAKQENN